MPTDLFDQAQAERAKTESPLALRMRPRMLDEFVGQQEIVLKSMSAFTGRLVGISGGTIMADGTVGLVVDIGAVLDRTSRAGRAA